MHLHGQATRRGDERSNLVLEVDVQPVAARRARRAGESGWCGHPSWGSSCKWPRRLKTVQSASFWTALFDHPASDNLVACTKTIFLGLRRLPSGAELLARSDDTLWPADDRPRVVDARPTSLVGSLGSRSVQAELGFKTRMRAASKLVPSGGFGRPRKVNMMALRVGGRSLLRNLHCQSSGRGSFCGRLRCVFVLGFPKNLYLTVGGAQYQPNSRSARVQAC